MCTTHTHSNKPPIYTGHHYRLHTLNRNHINLYICLKYAYYLKFLRYQNMYSNIPKNEIIGIMNNILENNNEIEKNTQK
jgi:hypothetical protein